MQTIWGFDLGVTSVGWAMIRWDEGAGQGEILRMGVRVFTECREAKRPGEVGDPLNATRRTKRLMRRTLRRKRWRRVHLRHALVGAGLLPRAAEPGKERTPCPPPPGFDPYAVRARGLTEALDPHDLGWALFHLMKRRGFLGSRKYGSAEEEGAEAKAPKAKGRKAKHDAEEETPELSKEEKDRQKQEAEARAKREKLRAEIAAIAARDGTDRATLAAALLARRDPVIRAAAERPKEFHDPARLRDAQQDRTMVSAEFEALWRAQAPHHPGVLTDALREKIAHIGFSQRPTFFRARTIGKCIYAPTEDRALKGDWLTQRFETLTLVNSLRLAHGNNPPLDPDQRATALAYLEGGWIGETEKPTWAGLREALTLGRQERFTHERGEKETIRGNATEAALRKALGEGWTVLAEPARQAIRDAIGMAVRDAEYRPARGGAILEIRDKEDWRRQREALAARATAEWGLTATHARALSEISLPDGYGRHARSTMLRLLAHLEAGKPYSEAVEAEFGARRESGAPQKKLPGPNQSELKAIKDDWVRERMAALLAGIRNPTVLRTLGELQKVVNALLRKYGRPDVIRLEFFRGLKQSREERAKTDKRQLDQERARGNAAREVTELGKPASPDNIRRWLLLREQGCRSPYSDRQISCTQALDAGATEIDHIFPVSRSFDPGPGNQVLCFADENREKRNRTPFEWLASEKPDTWAMLRTTVWPAMQKSGWPAWDHKNKRPAGKWARCLKENVEQADSEQFTNRQGTDSAFIAKAARGYLGMLWGGGQQGVNNVEPVPGRATALLRSAWGLNLNRLLHGVIEGDDAPKARDDLRHHAVDGLCVALCTRGRIKALSDWWQVRELYPDRGKPEFHAPWPGFHAQAKAAVEAIVVSHRVQAKISGQLHEETRLGDTGMEEDGFRFYVKRKPVSALSASEILGTRDAKLADDGVRRTLLLHLMDAGLLVVDGANRADAGAMSIKDLVAKVRGPLGKIDARKLTAALAQEIRLPMTVAGGPGPTRTTAGPLVRRAR
ncbi:MAG: type II CRISPR RNA-guided endonuclease Cas9, partial [Novosphingobium sp.]|nr:type II CRISPR RNA-guided endonuclease Cas9 [Novosphingobium sp.]